MYKTTNQLFVWSCYFLVSGVLIVMDSTAYAQATLESVLARMKPQTVIKIHYRETRFLDLLDQPWKGSGYFYVFPDGMIKEQWYPQRQVMAVKANKLYYFDPFADVRYQGEMEDVSGGQAIAFKGLMAGDVKLLQKYFQIEFQNQKKTWILTLIPKQSELAEQLSRIIISGTVNQPVNKIEVFLTDGDRHVMQLKTEEQGNQLNTKVEQLLAELQSKG